MLEPRVLMVHPIIFGDSRLVNRLTSIDGQSVNRLAVGDNWLGGQLDRRSDNQLAVGDSWSDGQLDSRSDNQLTETVSQ